MNEELKNALADLKNEMEGKSAKEVKDLMDAFEAKYENVNSELTKSVDELKENLKATQEHADKLDAKLQEKAKKDAKTGDALKDLITENFDQIKTVRRGKGIELKAAGDMTLSASLTGDQPRDYSMEVAMVPGQRLNVSDLVQTINISGGTYTFPRESGGEGTITTQTEGSDKALVDFDFTMVDVNSDFVAGYCNYSRKMANNLPFLESFLPNALRRNYWIAENTVFDAVLAAGVTASSQVITSQNKIEMLLAEIATLEGSNFYPNAIVMTPADYWNILETEKSTGAGYGLPGIVTLDGSGNLRINGIPLLRANWVDTNKYYVGDFSTVKKIVTEGLSVSFSEHDEDNFRTNSITGRVEAQVGLAIHRTDAIIYGDFTAT